MAEDLLLLLLDDEKGTLAASSHARQLFGGALLVELALDGLVAVEGRPRKWRAAKVRAVAETDAPADPELATALAVVAERPRSAQDLVGRLGKGVRERLQDRLVDRGVLQRREDRALGLFPHTTWRAVDVRHERELRERLQGVLVAGLEPDPRTGALVGLLAAVDQAHRQVDGQGLSAGQVRKRAKQVAEGAWAAAAVRDAVRAAQAAVMAGVMAATAATSAGSGGS